jgi:hypothetical protein
MGLHGRDRKGLRCHHALWRLVRNLPWRLIIIKHGTDGWMPHKRPLSLECVRMIVRFEIQDRLDAKMIISASQTTCPGTEYGANGWFVRVCRLG